MQHYVLGFVFDPSGGRVLLIRKNRPKWQAGSLNGIGGKVENGESPRQAMSREFFEEAGVVLEQSDWLHFGAMEAGDFCVWCFSAKSEAFDSARSLTDEEVCVVGARDFARIAAEGVGNLLTLLAHAQDPDRAFFRLAYREERAVCESVYDAAATLEGRALAA